MCMRVYLQGICDIEEEYPRSRGVEIKYEIKSDTQNT